MRTVQAEAPSHAEMRLLMERENLSVCVIICVCLSVCDYMCVLSVCDYMRVFEGFSPLAIKWLKIFG